MLENNNVVPIDLTQHPKADDWPENMRHHHATDWLLYTLEMGRPYDITNWPTPSTNRHDDIPEILNPIDMASSAEPKLEPNLEPPMPGAKENASPDEVMQVVCIWRQNRLMYPGWLTIPFSNRWNLERNTQDWRSKILASLSSLTIIERLRTVRELLWREEISLTPMHPRLESEIAETLELINCQDRTISGEYVSSEDWVSIREDWRNVAATLLTASRYRFDSATFEETITMLKPFCAEDLDLQHRIHHEKCLRAIWDMDFQALENLLADWNTENCDPVWMMRKSAILWEVKHDNEAKELLNRAIAAIQAMPKVESSLADHSRESWAVFVAIEEDNRSMFLTRLRELVSVRCDIFGERQAIIENMNRNKVKDDPPPFDVNVRSGGTSIHFTSYDPQVSTYQAVRLSEIAALPPHRSVNIYGNKLDSSVWSKVLRNAAEEIADTDLEFAVRLLLRANSSSTDKTLERILTRTRVAMMSVKQAENLIQPCFNIIDRELHQLSHLPSTEFKTAIEVLSRIVIRASLERIEAILDVVIGYCQNTELGKTYLGREIRNLLRRSWEALSEEQRRLRAIDLLNTEIVGLNGIEPREENSWPDPGELVEISNTQIPRTSENEQQWQSAIDLVTHGLTSSDTARHRGSIRMLALINSKQLTSDELQKIADAIWNEKYIAPDGLPTHVGGIFDYVFLTLPEPIQGLAQEGFRRRWLSHGEHSNYDIQRRTDGFQIYGNSLNGLNHNSQDVESRLWQVGRALQSLRVHSHHLKLSTIEKDHLGRLIEIWAEDAIPDQNYHNMLGILDDLNRQRIRDISDIMPALIRELTISDSLGEKLLAKMQQVLEKRMPALTLGVGLVKVIPNISEYIATALRIGLTSNDEEFAASAASGIHLWISETLNAESQYPDIPNDLVREIGIAIASRRGAVIVQALQLASWIFNEGRESHKEAIRQLVEDGLKYLAEELQYDREHEEPDEVPRKRLYCAELAVAMAKAGFDESSAVVRWLEIAKTDPLPEVRQAVDEEALRK